MYHQSYTVRVDSPPRDVQHGANSIYR